MPGRPDGGLAGRSWACWLLGLIPLGYPGEGSSELSWVDWLLSLIPLGPLGWASWLEVPGLGPWYPQCPPFPTKEEDHPRSEKNKQA